MADTRMSPAEREQFLAEMHVGVLSIPNPDAAPLSAPIWYDYQPGGEIWLLTGPDSLKGRLLSEGTQVTLVAQQETLPYKYVSVEGTVSAIAPVADAEEATRAMARRYLGDEMGDAYAAANSGNGSVRVSIRPQRWLTVDYAKSSPV